MVDANTFAAWGVDFLKVDGCNQISSYYAIGYPLMGAALEASGRGIAYSCSWPDYWMDHVHGNITSVDWGATRAATNFGLRGTLIATRRPSSR